MPSWPGLLRRGADEPTVTDAHLVLGRIPPSLLAGEIELDRAAAERAIQERIAEPLGLSAEAAAEGILAIVNASMAGAIRLVSIERGRDPRRFTLVPVRWGRTIARAGAGAVVRDSRVLVPRNPGVLSTYGLLTADLRSDFVRTRVWRGPEFPAAEVQTHFDELEADAWRSLRAEGVQPHESIVVRSADLRYRGQNFELRIDVPSGGIDAERLRALEAAFHAAHAARYSYALPNSRSSW